MTTHRYTTPAIFLHWLMAIGLLLTLALGLYMHDLPLTPWKLKLYAWHKWAGATLFLLALVRLGWRIGHPPPALPDAMPAWQKTSAEVLHKLLYLLMVAIPLSGWLMSSAKGFPLVYFGVLPIPDLIAKNPPLGDALKDVHATLNLLLACLAAGHVAAALKHQLVDRDGLLQRMLPGRPPESAR